MRADAGLRELDDLVRGSSLGGTAMDGLCARTPAASVAAIRRKAGDGTTATDPPPRRAAGVMRRVRGVRYPRRRLLLAAAGAVSVALFVGVSATRALDPRLRLAIADLVPAAAALASGAMCLHATRRRLPDLADHEARQLDRAWRLLGLAGLSWCAGELLWTWYELDGRATPLPSFADAGYMLAVPLMTAALLAFPTAAPRHLPGRLRVLLDGLVIALSLFGLTWLVSIDVLVTGEGGPWLWDRVVSGFYPLGDVVNLSIAVAALAHARKRALASFGLITAGIALLGVSDLGFLYLTQQDAYASGGTIDLGWCVGFFLIGFAALHRPTVPERPRGREAASLLRAVLPHLAMGALVSAVGVAALAGRSVDPEVLVGTSVVVLLSLGRHAACLWENARMRGELHARAAGPERVPVGQQAPERSG